MRGIIAHKVKALKPSRALYAFFDNMLDLLGACLYFIFSFSCVWVCCFFFSRETMDARRELWTHKLRANMRTLRTHHYGALLVPDDKYTRRMSRTEQKGKNKKNANKPCRVELMGSTRWLVMRNVFVIAKNGVLDNFSCADDTKCRSFRLFVFFVHFVFFSSFFVHQNSKVSDNPIALQSYYLVRVAAASQQKRDQQWLIKFWTPLFLFVGILANRNALVSPEDANDKCNEY